MADSCCGKPVEHRQLEAGQRRVLLIVMLINLVSCAMMLAASLHSGSSSLLSGTLDNFGDAMTYLLSLLVVGASLRAKANVALVKGLLIAGAALAVAAQIVWRLTHPSAVIFETMGLAALLNLILNGVCLAMLWPFRQGDVNLASAWECSRNDVFEGFAVLAAAGLVWAFGSGWPDLIVAIALLVMFSRSAVRVLRAGWQARREAIA